jgi:hypothetical protein
MRNLTATRPIALEPIPEMVAFAQRQVRNAKLHHAVERRSEQRHLVVVPVVAQPVDEAFVAIGSPFPMVTRDISTTGVGLIHSEYTEHRWLALRMTLAGENVELATKVLWCRALGPFYSLGCQVVADLQRRKKRQVKLDGHFASRVPFFRYRPHDKFPIRFDATR